MDKDHDLTSVKVCTDVRKTYIRGIQVSYGKFNALGELFDTVSLTPFGDLDQASSICSNFYVPQGDHISRVQYWHSVQGISKINLSLANSSSVLQLGVSLANDNQYDESFDEAGNFLFGFQGRIEKNFELLDDQLQAQQ